MPVFATTSEVLALTFFIHTAPSADHGLLITLCFSGIDSEGHAANFVETEQIVQCGGAKASFVQVSRRED